MNELLSKRNYPATYINELVPIQYYVVIAKSVENFNFEIISLKISFFVLYFLSNIHCLYLKREHVYEENRKDIVNGLEEDGKVYIIRVNSLNISSEDDKSKCKLRA